ncbi:hypothetical protein Q4E93_06345 [Flavitalea sp. BT771]|uniref:hypothetical protein n=1 Tax=Flavitalea sp. BT771 TaxID=3063329 RepID=UPI0026E2159A|nr:hypothetical protein [Flavitalea sp. BT771]MDO6430195.1 hypothetical protein [Flavitalea sp. BT771]MDV6219666.1 hypothetical protein [Flavitalea sp. BT771]
MQSKTADLDQQLTRQTEKYLQRMAHREARLQKKLAKVDSTAANNLFGNSTKQYLALAQKIRKDTSGRAVDLSGEYQPYIDSLGGILKFMKQGVPGRQALSGLPDAARQWEVLQAKMQDADQAKAFIQQRKQQIGDYIKQHINLSGLLGHQYAALNQEAYYYAQQVRQYKEMLNSPDKLERQALSTLQKFPAFQAFMKQNSQLAGLFNLPGNYGSPEGLAGLQTRDQVAALIQQQVAAGGPGGQAALQSNLQSAQSQLDGYKDKLNKLGAGSGDIDMPDFKPNNQKTKTFWRRLEYGANFQTTRNNYLFPTVSDLGLSIGYKLSEGSTVGVGASYKLGWGNGIQHIALSSQGVGLRSFIDIKIKGSFSATGGFEYNYTTPFRSFQQISHLTYWTRSCLVGISKTVSVKSRVFKKTKLQLFWDLLSYQQIPKTQPIIFRIGYNF